MIEERAIVSRIAEGRIFVRALGPESCPRCAEGKGCGGGVLGRLVGRRRPEVRVEGDPASHTGLKVGDTVVVGIDDAAVVRAALWVYLLPLSAMFLLGAFAHLVLQAHDVLVTAFGLTGLIGGFAVTRWFGNRAAESPHYRPALLRCERSEAQSCARLMP